MTEAEKVQKYCRLKEMWKYEEARCHIEDIRRTKFSIGAKELNPLTEDLHHAVTSLSAELYTKDVHFLMELIQNAEDNVYPKGVEPTLEFVLIKRDLTGTGAPATLLVFNNEVGFSKKNMDSICSVGRSTKKGKGNRQRGYIGEKGIGFKSVFLVSSQPHIFSNGYHVRFSEAPVSNCGIGYIVPEWIGEQHIVSSIHDVYGPEKDLPTTTIVLPLRLEKVEGVRAQLAQLHPELLLFLTKIKRLSVRDNDSDPKEADSGSAISISSETDHVVLRDKRANARVLHLSVKEKGDGSEETCRYFMWRQAFPVKPENKVCIRNDHEEWVISLAFPFGKRLTRGTSSVGIFAYLPTAMVTNFPFVIQADFILASSRETILLDNQWNLGILECVPSAFLNAFLSFLKEASSMSSITQAFEFIPVQTPPVPELNSIRMSIKIMLQNEKIVPCETFTGNIYYCKPNGAIKVPTNFQDLLFQIKEEGISLSGLLSLKKLVLHSSLCDEQYSRILQYIGVASAGNTYDWYENCIKACNFVLALSEKCYFDLLYFVANHINFGLKKIPLLKYVDMKGKVELLVASASQKIKILYASETKLHAWLSKCNEEFGWPNSMYFLPTSTLKALKKHEKRLYLCDGVLFNAGVNAYSAYEYGNRVYHHMRDVKQANKYAQFLYHSYLQKFLKKLEVADLCWKMPIIDGSGSLRLYRAGTLVPASGSKWSKLFEPVNPFSCQNFVDLGDIYARDGQFAGCLTPKDKVLTFLVKHTKALDLPELNVPDKALSKMFSELTSDQAFLLLDWIRFHRTKGSALSESFLKSIQAERWMKTYSGFRHPNQSILVNESGEVIFEIMRNVLKNLCVVDQEFYANRINLYADELRLFGVGFGLDDVQKLLFTHFKSLASSGMEKECAISLLMFISILKGRNNLEKDWLETIKNGKWLRTSHGYYAPRGSVFLQSVTEVDTVSKITRLPVVDEMFYANKISSFLSELELLEVVLDQNKIYSLITESFTFPSESASMTADCGLLILKCVKYLGSSASGFIEKVMNLPWLKTNLGMKCPWESILPDLEWASLLLVVELPIIDEAFYGHAMRSYMSELKSCGVATDINSTLKVVVNQIRFLLSSNSLTPVSVFLLLNYIRETSNSVAQELISGLLQEKWLKTRHGYRAPGESILFTSKWGTVMSFVDLPLIDDSFYGVDIYGYKDQLKMMGIVTDFTEGAPFIAAGLKPIEPSVISTEGTISIIESVQSLMSKINGQQLLDDFVSKLKGSKWLKTMSGYKKPEDCILFDVAWKPILKKTDEAIIDEKVYGNNISAYKNELKAIGVKVDPKDVCVLLYRLLPSYTETSLITRIYWFFRNFQFVPEFMNKSSSQVWIPNQNSAAGQGEWVNSQVCVLHDKDNLFSSHLYSLDKYYQKDLLPMFASVYNVVEFPSLDDYLQVWNSWALRENHSVTAVECRSFWGYILDNWNPYTEEQLKQKLTKLPADICSGDKIHLVSKEACFLPDDLQMKKIFMSVRSEPLFVWFPKSFTLSSVSSRELYEIYSCIGVRKISECIECNVGSILSSRQSMKPYLKKGLINKGLARLILGFLSGPQINMAVKDRHKVVKSLIDLSVFGSDGCIKISYRLILSSNSVAEVEAKKIILWDKNSQLLLIDRSDYIDEETDIEFVSCFAQEIAEGVVSQAGTSAVDNLSKIIQMGFVYGFKEDAVDFLLTKENLQLFMEDEEFLRAHCALPIHCGNAHSECKNRKLLELGTSTPMPQCKRLHK